MNTSIEKGRIYHPWHLWEDYNHGFYDKNINKHLTKNDVLCFFNDELLVKYYMQLVIDKWVISCEQNLSNTNMNRIAWLGQAAMCMYKGTPCYNTMYAWKYLEFSIQNRSDIIAYEIIKKWEQKIKLNRILKNGKIEDTQMEYQMKHQVSLNFQD